MKNYLVILSLLLCFHCEAQKRDYHWTFGTLVGINFNSVTPSVDTTIKTISLEASATIADENGNLLFYVGSENSSFSTPGANKFVVRNALDSVMPGGDSLAGHTSITQGLIILPDPGDTARYYIFHITYPGDKLYYSKVDMSLNNGLGEVVSSNNLLNNNVLEKMHSVKAANGRDWWLITTYYSPSTDYFRKYKIDSSGVHYKGTQIFPTLFNNGYSAFGQMIFSKDGEKLMYSGGVDITYLFNFDRCIGEFSNQIGIDTFTFGIDAGSRYGASLSPSGRYAYLSTSEGYIDSLWQFDTQASNINASRQLIFATQPLYDFTMGQHMLGPDGKIYIANVYAGGLSTPLDSLNTHLSVIQTPDSPGVACNFAPYSFSLHNRICLLGLPNLPNYNLGQLENVNCDSILAAGINDFNPQLQFMIYPNPAKDKVKIKWKDVDAKGITFELLSMEGKVINEFFVEGPSNEASINLSNALPGIYIIRFTINHLLLESHKLVITP